MLIIANALANHNPFAYLLLFVIFVPPIMIILMAIVDKIKKIIKKKRNKK